MRTTAAFLAALLCAAAARAELVFEPEEPEKQPVPVIETWKAPALSFDLLNRFTLDTHFDGHGENVASWLRLADASVKTSKGPVRVRIAARLRWVTSLEAFTGDPRRRSAFEPTLGETAVDVTAWGVDFSAGFLDIAWGRNALFAPADVLTSSDLRDGPIAGPASRVPVAALRAKGTIGLVSWDAVYLPVFTPSRLPLVGNDWGPFLPNRPTVFPDVTGLLDPTSYAALEPALSATKYPQNDLTAPQGGLRLSTRAGPVDVALSWAEYFDKQPRYTYSPAFERLSDAVQAGASGQALVALADVQTDLGHGISPLVGQFQRTRVFAVDAAVATGPVRWTFDAGYSPRRVFATPDLHSVSVPMASGALAAEYDGAFQGTAGVYAMQLFGVPADTRLLFFDRDAGPSPVRDVTLVLGYAGVFGDALDGRFTYRALVLASPFGDVFASPRFGWKWDDSNTVAAGANVVRGTGGGPGALYHRNTEAFVEYVLSL